MEGQIERIWITEIATDGIHLVGHTKGYVQMLVVGPESMLGTSTIVRITSVGRWSVFGEVIENLNKVNINNMDVVSSERRDSGVICSPCSNLDETHECSRDPEPCACEQQCCRGQRTLDEATVSVSKTDSRPEDQSSQNFIGWLVRKWNLQKSIEMGLS